MVGDPRRFEAIDQAFERSQIFGVERTGSADIERYAMHRDWRGLPYAGENLERTAARDHEILGDNLEPVGARAAREHIGKVAGSQSDPMTQMAQPWHFR